MLFPQLVIQLRRKAGGAKRKSSNTWHNPEKDRSLVMFASCFIPRIESVVCYANLRRLGRITCPRQSVVRVKNRHFFRLNVSPTLRNIVVTARKWPTCFWKDLRMITIMSKYAMANQHLTVESMTTTVSWNVLGALRNSIGLPINR